MTSDVLVYAYTCRLATLVRNLSCPLSVREWCLYSIGENYQHCQCHDCFVVCTHVTTFLPSFPYVQGLPSLPSTNWLETHVRHLHVQMYCELQCQTCHVSLFAHLEPLQDFRSFIIVVITIIIMSLRYSLRSCFHWLNMRQIILLWLSGWGRSQEEWI